MTGSRTFISLAAAILLGCSSNPAPGTRVDTRVLTRDEIAKSGLVGSAFDIISRLRPSYLVSRGQSSIKGESSTLWPNVYLDGIAYGDIQSLRTIDSFQIAEVRLYQAWEAQTKFGMGNPNGVIDITTRR
jgi:hypothetical protein